jgi:hypothetical protein
MKNYLKRQIELKKKKAEEQFKDNLDEATRTQALLD